MYGLTLRQVRAFLVTVELGSVSAAARNLGLTQPAIGQQLREFEAQLRVKLFEKVGTRLHPAQAGLALVQPARELLASVGRLYEAGARFRAGNSGQIRLGTGATACICFLPEPIRQTKQALPGVEIAVTTGNTAPMLDALLQGTLDLALVAAPHDSLPRSLEAELLFHDPLCALLPKSLAADLARYPTPQDLAAHPLIMHSEGSATRQLADAWFHHAAIVPTPTMEFDSVVAITELVAAGLGCSIIPMMAMTKERPDLELRFLDPPVARPISLVMRANQVPDAALRMLLGKIRAAAAAMPRHEAPPEA